MYAGQCRPSRTAAKMGVEFRLLGDVEVRVDGAAVDIGHIRQRCVLVALAVDANRVVPVDRLVDRVWGERSPPQARSTLRGYLSRLRRALAAAEADITRSPGGYVLTVDPMAVDVHRFGRLLADAGTADDDERAESLYEQALALWRGEAFATLDTEWLNAARDGLEGQRLAAVLNRNDVALARGSHDRLLPDLMRYAASYPMDERLAGQLMLALYRGGRQADALETFRHIRRRLIEELGTEPGAVLQRLHQQILSADPALCEPFGTGEAASRGSDRDGLSARVPRQLPASPSGFTGRSGELTALDKIMDARSDADATMVIATIGGPGGVGKTWLALRWANDNADRFPGGQLYANLRGFDPISEPVTASATLRGFLEALGADPARVPVDPDAQAALYRSLVAGRHLLIVLDNARDTATVAPLLPGAATSAVLVTSRRQLPGLVTTHGARPLALDMLPASDAEALLARQVGMERMATEPSAVAVILEHCAGLPLALGITAARAALQPGLPLAALAAELRAATTRLDALDAGELTVDLRAVLSCSHRALTPAAAADFAMLGLAPGGDLSLAAAASLIAATTEQTRSRLRQLIDAHLVQEHLPGRYRMHDLVRLYASELAGGGPPAPLSRLLDHYLHTAHRAALLLSPQREPLTLAPAVAGVVIADLADLDAAMAWFTAEHPVLLAAIRHAATTGFDVHAWQLPWTLATYFDRRGHWNDWATVQQAAVASARRLGDRPAQAQAHRLLANALSNLRRYDDTHTELTHALELFDDLADDAGRAHTHFDLALMFDRQQDPQTALHHANHALRLYRAVETPLKLAVALNAVGWYHTQLGQHRAAITHCTEALALARQAASPYGQANTLDSLGYAHHHLGEYQQAIARYQEALDLFRDIGDRHAEAIVLDHLGDTHHASGNRAPARHAWLTALEILEPLGHADAGTVRAKLR
jgi:DNA-binding SARP family transcriptional activator